MRLEPPVKRYLLGKLPSHSSSVSLADNFKNVDNYAIMFVLSKGGYVDNDFKIQRKALVDGLVDVCERNALWNLEKVQDFLSNEGLYVERVYVNQKLSVSSQGNPQWVNLGTVATYFNVSAHQIGKWLDSLGLRDDSMPTEDAVKRGLATITEMNTTTNGKKKRKIAMWELSLIQEILVKHGHPLDFQYDTVLKGKGRNSDVEVITIDSKARDFAKEFSQLFKNPKTRSETVRLVSKTPKIIITKAEVLLNKPGFISQNEYKKYIK